MPENVMCYSTTILSSKQMYYSDATKEDDLDGTACPRVSKLKKKKTYATREARLFC